MRYCDTCDTLLDGAEAALAQCPVCGADLMLGTDGAPPNGKSLIIGDDEVDHLGPTVPIEARLTPQERVAIASADPSDLGFDLPKNVPPPRSSFAGLMIGLGLAVLIMLLCSVAAFTSLNFTLPNFAQAQSLRQPAGHSQGATPTSSIFSFPTQVAEPTPLPFTGQIPTPAPTQTPFGGVTATPPSGDNPTPTPTGLQPTLSASAATCGFGKKIATFILTATNLGLSVMSWEFVGSSPSTYETRPLSGTLTAEFSSQKVNAINLAGTISSATIFIDYSVPGTPGGQLAVGINCP